MPLETGAISREHIEEWLVALPTENMRPPRIPESPPDVLRDEDLARLL